MRNNYCNCNKSDVQRNFRNYTYIFSCINMTLPSNQGTEGIQLTRLTINQKNYTNFENGSNSWSAEVTMTAKESEAIFHHWLWWPHHHHQVVFWQRSDASSWNQRSRSQCHLLIKQPLQINLELPQSHIFVWGYITITNDPEYLDVAHFFKAGLCPHIIIDISKSWALHISHVCDFSVVIDHW
jgi:hypothetical protein